MTQFRLNPSLETPPRMWRKLGADRDQVLLNGNTSTYVEKTKESVKYKKELQKHLHVCGENCM